MVHVEPPQARSCERCGRAEVWSDDRGAWVAKDPEDPDRLGNPHCVHDWDITGTYNPVVQS